MTDKDEMKNRISMALKDPILQQGFEIICKESAISEHDREHNDYELTEVYSKLDKLEKENAELKEKLGDVQMQKAGEKSNLVWKLKTTNEQKAEQLTKAKDLLLKLSTCLEGHSNNNFEYELIKEAEQFLEEVKDVRHQEAK